MGHEDQELARLELQSRVYRPLTEALLRDAGLRPGMRVLDVGCGVGDVSFLIAELVGPKGKVVGIDSAERPLEWARQRARKQGLSQVEFIHAAMESFSSSQPFDAVVGRLVLAHQPDPLAFLRRMGEHLVPGGVLVCHEMDFSSCPMAHPSIPLFDRMHEWLLGLEKLLPLRIRMGQELVGLMRQAGFKVEGCRYEGPVGAHVEDDVEVLRVVTEGTRTLMPHVVRLGLATAAEMDIDTLEQRVRDEARAAGGMFIPFMMGGAWTRRPAVT
ncbi:hypothetical protein MFUL124B02_40130 [Myxococcus fulvus 124B02]|nr:hypothetical protein MFUL124B02_40130 [Myxococcus fulvus 124B02]